MNEICNSEERGRKAIKKIFKMAGMENAPDPETEPISEVLKFLQEEK